MRVSTLARALTVVRATTVVISAAACSSSDPGVTVAAPGATTTPPVSRPVKTWVMATTLRLTDRGRRHRGPERETVTATCPLGTTSVFLYPKT